MTDSAGETAEASVSITENAAGLPTADAGPDQTVYEDGAVSFNGGGSSDSDGSIVGYPPGPEAVMAG
ncbi:hypothetical protein WMF30_29135 [Sorangium sp. So ce134]